MELIWTAFVLGLVGSLHCAVMCGPLVLAVTGARAAGRPVRCSRFIYHAGRLTVYAGLGALFGAVGKTFALAGMQRFADADGGVALLQRWLSIVAGVSILMGLLFSTRLAFLVPFSRLVVKLKSVFVRLLQRRTLASQFFLGLINGLLPCGLVYIAAAGAATTLSPAIGALHMIAFGVGTLPMLLGVSTLGRLRFASAHVRKLIPASAALVAILLIIRGMALGIPYLSPAMTGSVSCH